jgi:hypothetical protein
LLSVQPNGGETENNNGKNPNSGTHRLHSPEPSLIPRLIVQSAGHVR